MKSVWRSMIWTLIVEIFIPWIGYNNTHSTKLVLICVIIILVGGCPLSSSMKEENI